VNLGARTIAATLMMLFGPTGCDETFRFDVTPDQDGGNGDAGDGSTGAPPPGSCANDSACGDAKCDVTSGVCVGCLADADCSSGRSKCEPTTHVCVACLNGPDCGMRQTCDTVTNRCLDACFDADDICPLPGFVCDRDRALCIECKTSASCVGSPNGPFCDVLIGRCVACTGNAQCPATKAVCDRRSGTCQECVTSPSCGSGNVCDPMTLVCRNVL
jgi:Cys-rich repeat protein